jgi:hypothetical protein
MYQLILVMTTYWNAADQSVIGGVTSQIITNNDNEVLKDKALNAVAQFEKQGITVAWTIV